jgi:hypothetical protein
MVKVIPKNQESLQSAKRKTRGQVNFRKTTKWGIVAVKSKWPKKKKSGRI